MFLASLNDQKYPRCPLALKFNVTLARPLRLVIPYFFQWKFLSDVRRLYLHDSKWNLRSDVDGLTHTKQLLNLLCIVYIRKVIWKERYPLANICDDVMSLEAAHYVLPSVCWCHSGGTLDSYLIEWRVTIARSCFLKKMVELIEDLF